MRLLYVNKIHTNSGWGAEQYLSVSLRKVGVELIHLDYALQSGRVGAELCRLDRQFDAVLVQRGTGYLFPYKLLDSVKRPKVLLFTELVRRNLDQSPLFRRALFDHMFVRTAECKKTLVSEFHNDATNISVMLSAVPENLLNDAASEYARPVDVLFSGTMTIRRKSFLSRLGDSLPVSLCSDFGSKMFTALRSAKIVLNIHADDFLDTETRVFEALGAKSLLITEQLSPESPFKSGRHLIEVYSPREMADATRYYLEHEKERKEIAEAGYTDVNLKHRYDNRAMELTGIFEGLSSRVNYGGPAISPWANVVACREECASTMISLASRAKSCLKRIIQGSDCQ